MSPPTPPSDPTGPTVDVDPERAKHDVDPERAKHDVDPEPDHQNVDPARSAIPDHDPFTDTDVYPELSQRPSTGGFAGLSRSAGPMASQPSPYRSPLDAVTPIAPPGSAMPTRPVEAPSAPPFGSTAVLPLTPPTSVNPPLPAPSFRPASPANLAPSGQAAGADHRFAPSVGSPSDPALSASASASRSPSAAWPGPAAAPVPPGPPDPPGPRSRRQAFGRGPLITVAALAAVVLIGLGAVVGALLSNRANTDGELASPLPATTPATTASSKIETQTTQPSRTQPQPSTTVTVTTAATATPPSTAPTTAGSATDPNAVVADFRWSPDPVTAGRSITIADASTGNPNRWVWRWNGNTVSSTQPKGFTTSLQEDTEITLTVCRGNGPNNCDSVTKTVIVD